MKFRRTMSAICSSALALGLTFLLYPQTQSVGGNGPVPTVTPSNKLTLAPSVEAPTPEATIEPTNAPTPTETPTYVHPLYTNEFTTPMASVSDLIAAYITGYYANDLETISALVTEPSLLSPVTMKNNTQGVTGVTDITLYGKPGINGIFSVVYATYSLSCGNSSVKIPQFSEYYIQRNDDGSFLINTSKLPTETQELLAEARKTEGVLNLAISTLIQRYNNACLLGDETLLKQCVTDSDYLNIDYFSSRYAYTEYFSDYEFILHPGINEFDYMVYVIYNEKIVLIDTPAPCMECYYISLDKTTGKPLIYLGITSLDTDAYRASVDQSDEIQALAIATDQAMTEAMLADDDLMDFYNRLTSGQ
ncbi:MAG: hypothetical protein IJW37_02215 [Lachnospiraceae bacterium]|nr:hypothetical protein [Lachnospiraceae bacterium]